MDQFSRDPNKRRPQSGIGRLVALALLTLFVVCAGYTIYLVASWTVFKASNQNPAKAIAEVVQSETDATTMVLELRMPEPFRVVLNHSLEEPDAAPKGSGITVRAVKVLRQEEAMDIPSESGGFRGHIVRISISRGERLSIQSNGQTGTIAPWTMPDASNSEWKNPPRGTEFGDGGGQAIVQIGAGTDSKEVLSFFAQTEREIKRLNELKSRKGK